MHREPLRIAVVLPRREGFSKTQFGALTLCAYDTGVHSRFRESICIYGGRTPESEALNGIRYRYIPTPKWRHTISKTKTFALELVKVFKTEQPHLVEVYNRPEIARYIGRRIDTPVCQHYQNDPQEYVGRWRGKSERKRILEKSAMVFCVSDYIREQLLEGIDSDRSDSAATVYNAIDVRAVQHPPAAERKKQFIYVGRLIEEKGVLEFVRAARQILPSLPDWRAVVVGAPRPKSAYGKAVLDAVSNLGPQGEYLGFLPHEAIMAEFCRSEIAVLPSYWPEPFGRTIVEAMAAGCALITCANGGIPEIVKDTAMFAQNHDIYDLAQQMEMLAEDEALRRKCARKAYDRVLNHFDIRETTARLDAFRQKVLDRRYGPGKF